MTEPSVPDQFTEPPMEEERPPIGAVGRLIGVITSPGETFADINRAPTWAVALIVTIIFSVGFVYLLQARVPNFEQRIEEAMKRQLEQAIEKQGGPKPSEEALEEQLAFQKRFLKFAPLVPLLFVPIGACIIAGVFFLALLMVQADVGFKKVFSVVSWSWVATTVIQMTISAIVLMLRDPTRLDPTDRQGILMSNLAALLSLSSKSNPAVYALASMIDIFSIWFLVLLTIGLSAISKKVSRTKAAVIVLVLWGLWAVIQTGWAKFVSSRVG
jgi:hypothetical protein